MLAWEFTPPAWRRVAAGVEVAWHADDDEAVITVCDVLETPHGAAYLDAIARPCLELVVPGGVNAFVSDGGARGLVCALAVGPIDREVALLGVNDAVFLARLDVRRGVPGAAAHLAAWRRLLASVRAGARPHSAPVHWVE